MNDKPVSWYHRGLRVSVLVVAMALVFDSGLLFPVTQQLSSQAGQYLANVISVGAGVIPTELNTVTAELTKQQRELDEREASLTERELAVGLRQSADGESSLSTYILSILLFIILVLIILNYALDMARERYLLSLKHQLENEKAS